MRARTQEIIAADSSAFRVPSQSGAPNRVSDADSGRAGFANQRTPILNVPLVGPVLGGDEAAYNTLVSRLEEMTSFANHLKSHARDGRLDFRETLKALGWDGAEALSEAEAAAEFIRQAARFKGFLDAWSEALALGPWDFSGVDLDRPIGEHAATPVWLLLGQIANVSQVMHGALAQASWRSGDSQSAWNHWQAMNQNAERAGDGESTMAILVQASLRRRVAQTASLGMHSGGWSDDQLAALPNALGQMRAIDDARRGIDGEKRRQERWIKTLGTPGNAFTESLVHPLNSWTTNFVNTLAIGLTTEQQKTDNLAILHHSLDRSLASFDPVTGILLSPVPVRPEPGATNPGWQSPLEKFYFMYSGDPDQSSVAESSVPSAIVGSQSRHDQVRLAAALELHRRQNGQYPATLESVAWRFPAGLPTDPASGDPFRYEVGENGTYRLWGRGVDRVDNNADRQTDIVWFIPAE